MSGSTALSTTDLRAVWKDTLLTIGQQVSPLDLATWFKNTGLLKLDKTVAVIGAPSEIVRLRLLGEFEPTIREALISLTPDIERLDFVVDSSLIAARDTRKVAIGNVVRKLHTTELRTQSEGVMTKPGVATRPLNPRYRLNNFIVGDDNRLAHAAATAVAARPGHAYNPLFIYGGVGLGKTHLLQAVGNEIAVKNPKSIVVYTTSERFTADYIEAARGGTKKIEKFRNKYRSVDVLIIDDIQFIAGKDKTQEEVFHTFNSLYELNKQIVFSSDRAPKELVGIEDRLRSRFEAGMVVDIHLPDFETRLAILQAKAAEAGQMIKMEILELIAYNVTHSVRELEGVLTQVIAYMDLDSKWTPTVLAVEEILQRTGTVRDVQNLNAAMPAKVRLRCKDVVRVVADHYDLKRKEVKGNSRQKEIRHARQVAMYLCKRELGYPYEKIGRLFGGKNHTTVMHAVRKIEDNKDDENLKRDLRIIRQRLANGE